MGFEIDFLPVGNGEHSGDAICIRYGVPNNYKVLVYDGGSQESGDSMIDHIRNYYKTDTVDYLISSHPDSDHVNGLSKILKELKVKEVWMHRPWNYCSQIISYFKDQRISVTSLEKTLKEQLNTAYTLESLALSKNVPIYEPFQNSTIDLFKVLSPIKSCYINNLIPSFNKTPEAKTSYSKLVSPTDIQLSEQIEKWEKDNLIEEVSTSAENESSVILWGILDNIKILLTGDAGINALTTAINFFNMSLPVRPDFIQIPHHGSRHNVSPKILNNLIGPITKNGMNSISAYVSASKNSKDHPKKSVVNAFIRRDAKVFQTKGHIISYSQNMPARIGWISLDSLSFFNKSESWD